MTTHALTYQGRLPGITVEAVPETLNLDPLRMDVAGFVGFAERGPLDTPVLVEDINQYRAVFGGDVMIARSKGTDYVYTFLKSFYADPAKGTGVNNLSLPGAAMPHVLWELQGTQDAVWEGHVDEQGNAQKHFKEFQLATPGKLTPEEGERILRHARDKGLRFGDAAVALKLVSQDDIAQMLARQFDYPYLVPGQSNVSPEVVAAWSPFSQQMEALRALRSQLLMRWFTGEKDRRSLAIVSPGRGEGRSHLAANLAVKFSQMGEKTLLIDADLRSPRQHSLFGLGHVTGC